MYVHNFLGFSISVPAPGRYRSETLALTMEHLQSLPSRDKNSSIITSAPFTKSVPYPGVRGVAVQRSHSLKSPESSSVRSLPDRRNVEFSGAGWNRRP